MNSMVLGRYIPYDSIIHRLDPRAKIYSMIILLIAVFIPSGFYGYLVIGSVVLLATLLSNVPLKSFLQGFKPLIFMMAFLMLINVFVVQSGDVLLTVGWFKLYSGAVFQTLYILVRLLLMIAITTILTVTTKPLDLTMAFEKLLKPFKRFGLPAHEISMTISIALRFIPIILEEALRIMKAQQSRGVDYEEGKLKEKIRAILALIVPLFVCAFQRAEDLANAMEARGYNPQGQRTKFRQLKYHYRDAVLILVSTSALVAVIIIGSVI